MSCLAQRRDRGADRNDCGDVLWASTTVISRRARARSFDCEYRPGAFFRLWAPSELDLSFAGPVLHPPSVHNRHFAQGPGAFFRL